MKEKTREIIKDCMIVLGFLTAIISLLIALISIYQQTNTEEKVENLITEFESIKANNATLGNLIINCPEGTKAQISLRNNSIFNECIPK